MHAVHHVCRLGTIEDVKKSAPLWQQDRALFDSDVWAEMPCLLERLLRSERVRLAYIESFPGGEPRLLGGISFIDPTYVEEALAKRSTLPNTVFRAVLEGRSPFFGPREIGPLNLRCALHLLNFFGNISDIDLSRAEMANFYEFNNRAYHFLHFGYAYQALWADVLRPHHVVELQSQGMRIERELKLPTGETSTLMCMTRDIALANPYLRRSGYFFPLRPRFQLSLGEQKLLELTLLDMSDDGIAATLHLSRDAVKKRWRSIYSKVECADPELLAGVESGTGRRRAFLGYLRVHLEELRPSCN